MEYELQDGGEVVATLRFRSSFGSFATAESADGCWTFKRVGFWKTRVTVRASGSESDIASFRNNTWKHGGTLELPDGRAYPANTNFWMTEYEFTTQSGEPLLKYSRVRGVLRLSSTVEIQPAAASLTELPWLLMLGWYLTVMIHVDSTVMVAAATSG
jgi:hypothetical protein